MSKNRNVWWGNELVDMDAVCKYEVEHPAGGLEDTMVKIDPLYAHHLARAIAAACRERWPDVCLGQLLQHMEVQLYAVGRSLLRSHDLEEPMPYNPPRRRVPKARIGRLLAKAVMERDAYRCRTCGGHLDLTVDHVHPESQGGSTTLDNLQTLCRPCNSRKGAILPP
jgi:5-methylcytosine-specific restriction endonuclease McrA